MRGKFSEERNKWIVGLTVVVAVAAVLFGLLYYADHCRWRTFDPTGMERDAAGIQCKLNYLGAIDDNYWRISGYAYREGTQIGVIDSYYVLQDVETDTWYQLRTEPVEMSGIASGETAQGEEIDYTKAGLSAVIPIKKLTGTYHVYIVYGDGNSESLMDTGEEFSTCLE